MPPASDPIADQGHAAKELGLTEAECPYGEGANRDAWLKGFGTKADDLL